MLKPETNTPLLEDLQAQALDMLKAIDLLDEDKSLSMVLTRIKEAVQAQLHELI